MEIRIDKKYAIRSDDKNYILSEERITKEGKKIGAKYWYDIGFYRNLEQLLIEYKHLIVRTSSIHTFRDLILALTKVDATFQQILLKMEGK